MEKVDLTIQRMRSLRFLADDTLLGETTDEFIKQILKDWKRTTEHIPPLEWIERHYIRLAAQLFLQHILIDVRNRLQSQAARSAHAVNLPDTRKYLDIFAGLRELFDQLPHQIDYQYSEADLRDAFWRLKRNFSDKAGMVSLTGTEPETLLLLVNMLQDNRLRDPVSWLQEQHSYRTRVFLIEHVTTQVLPEPVTWSTWSPVSLQRFALSKIRRMGASNIVVRLRHISQLSDGFCLYFSFATQRSFVDFDRYHYWWDADYDLYSRKGDRYIVCYDEFGYESYLFGMRYTLRLLCYPALQGPPKEIELKMKNAKIIGKRKTSDNYYDTQEHFLGDATWNLR